MSVQTALRRKAGRGQDQNAGADQPSRNKPNESQRYACRHAKQCEQGQNTSHPALPIRRGRAVQTAFQAGDHHAHPGDRMPDHAVDESRIADRRLQEESGQRQFDVG